MSFCFEFTIENKLFRMNESHNQQSLNIKREDSLDFIRGISVIFMILAHGIFFFHDSSNLILTTIARTGNIICFTMFLFVSGASLYYGYLQNNTVLKEKTKKFFSRTFYLLIGFYILAFVVRANIFSIYPIDLRKITAIFIFQDVPNFTEFLFPFIFLSFSSIVLRKIYRKLSSSLLLTAVISIIFYFLGMLLYTLNIPSPYKEIKALFVGDASLLYFPLFQYLPVFLFGIYWGRYLFHTTSLSIRESLELKAGIILTIFIIFASFISNQYYLPLLEPLHRWPPSINFLALGVVSVFLLYLIYDNTKKIKPFDLFWEVMNYFGRDAFDLFIVHLLLLFLYQNLGGRQFTSPITVTLLLFVLFILSAFISSLNWKISPSIFRLPRLNPSGKGKYRPKKRHFILAFTLIGIVIWNLNYGKGTLFGSTIDPSRIFQRNIEPLPSVTLEIIDNGELPWFNQNYNYFKQLDVQNISSIVAINDSTSIALTFNHQEMVEKEQSKENGTDLLLVYFLDNHYFQIPFKIENSGTTNTTITFNLKEKIYPLKNDNRYFLYYGTDFPIAKNNFNNQSDNISNYKIILADSYHQKYLTTIDRQWYTKNAPKKYGLSSLIFTVEVRSNETEDLYYQIPEAGIREKLQEIGTQKYQAVIDLQKINYNTYTIFCENEQSIPLGSKQQFYLSAPVYVAWTFDWEGFDVNQSYLDAITAQVNRHYNIPLTHFFNPRIYLPSVVSAERANYLTSFVKQRQEIYGDEVQLHLHMHYDLIEASGVSVRKESKWGKNTDGYDVLTTSYTEEELGKIIAWAIKQFQVHGFSNPSGYRAGGWFADEKVLQVLQNQGFKYDASGREKYLWGGILTSPWDLNSLSQPFYPDKNNQNITSNNTFNI